MAIFIINAEKGLCLLNANRLAINHFQFKGVNTFMLIYSQIAAMKLPIKLLTILGLFTCCLLNAQHFNNFEITVGAERYQEYKKHIDGKRIACVVNPSSQVANTHLVDFLLSNNQNVVQIFSPEHGFRGKADAGAIIKDGKDSKTGLPIISLYGKNKKPSQAQLQGIDVVLFDLQDVGTRFYTYISTMHYVMEACAEKGIPFIVLDRPNPNGHFVDGFIREEAHQSFVGMHPIPIVHGMTVGELACMINEEGWLKNNLKCELEIIECEGYDHSKFYQLPVKPSPNLPNMHSVYLYPSLCFFEATKISIGRGTDKPFQIIGHPHFKGDGTYKFMPVSSEGASKPKLMNQQCFGIDLSTLTIENLQNTQQINWDLLVDFYTTYPLNKEEAFFTSFIDKLAGTSRLNDLIEAGATSDEIRASYADELADFEKLRKKYLLYKDFEKE